jgi:hypothetical protein
VGLAQAVSFPQSAHLDGNVVRAHHFLLSGQAPRLIG